MNMITEQRREGILRPFQMLMSRFDAELTVAADTLNEWNKARSISASTAATPDNIGLSEKIHQFELGKNSLQVFIERLVTRLKLEAIDFDSAMPAIRSSYKDFSLKLGGALALVNYRYTSIQKNEINRRITAVNSSNMLNNADMDHLQQHWRRVQTMENNERLIASQKIFEERLGQWENIIAQRERDKVIRSR